MIENIFLTLSSDLLLKEWRIFRNSLQNYNEYEQLKRISEWFSVSPLVDYYLNPDDKNSWGTPWSVLYNNKLCNVSIAYLMEQTLLLTEKWKKDRIKLIYIKDTKNQEEKMCLLIDDKYVLNYYINEVIDWNLIENNCYIQQTY